MSTSKTAKSTTASTKKATQRFSDDERAAMKERARELKAEARADRDRAAGEKDLLAKIAEMPEHDRTIATRVHAIVTANAPELQPKTWYGMPAYARDGKILCFLQGAEKFKTRYVTLGFNDAAKLDNGDMWPTAYALTALSPAEERKIAALVKKAVR